MRDRAIEVLRTSFEFTVIIAESMCLGISGRTWLSIKFDCLLGSRTTLEGITCTLVKGEREREGERGREREREGERGREREREGERGREREREGERGRERVRERERERGIL